MAIHSTLDPGKARPLLLAAVLFLSYLCIGMALPTTAVFVTHDLNLGGAWAGLAVGATFLSTIVTRGYAGKVIDQRGARTATRRGLFLYLAGTLAALAAGLMSALPLLAYAVLVMGRLVVGLGESLAVIGIVAWAIGLAGPASSGRVMAMVGAAMYGALAVGGPLGLALGDHVGFAGAMTAAALLPCAGLLAILRLADLPPAPHRDRPPFWRVIRQIWLQGAVVGLQGVGFAAIGAFFALDFLDRGWNYAGLGLTAFGAGFVLVRLLLGGLPDRLGGVNVALGSLAVEAVGQFLIWSAPTPALALAGAFMTGLGCSLVYPAMGREVVRLVEPHLRATALGGFSAFQDLAYGLTGPLVGLLAERAGYSGAFLVGCLTSAAGFAMALLLRRRG